MSASGMAKSSNLPYHAPFRYSRPGEDVKAVLGAQIGNPRVTPVEKAKAAKQSTVAKKGKSAAGGKASKPKASKPAGTSKSKTKKPTGKR